MLLLLTPLPFVGEVDRALARAGEGEIFLRRNNSH